MVRAQSAVVGTAELGAALLSRADELSYTMLGLMRRDVSFHRTVTLVSDDQLRATVRTHLDFILGAFGAPQLNYDTRAAAATGRSRAAVGVPLPAVMDSYRICARFLWDELQAEAARRPGVTAVGLLRASEAMWKVLEDFTTAMVTGYQEQIAQQMVTRQQERSAMVQALIDGRLTDTVDLWNTADTLRISLHGPYVVVCAELTRISRTGFPDIEDRLSARGIFSAWRLQPDIEIGILHLGPSTGLDPVLEVLAEYPVTRVGVSPLFDDLADAFGLTIERVGPYFGSEHLFDVLADSSTLAHLAGEQTRLVWPGHHDLRRIPIRHPTPVYPHSLIWHQNNTHPALGTLRNYLASRQGKRPDAQTWVPAWAQPPTPS